MSELSVSLAADLRCEDRQQLGTALGNRCLSLFICARSCCTFGSFSPFEVVTSASARSVSN
jgi:hypothetical protein